MMNAARAGYSSAYFFLGKMHSDSNFKTVPNDPEYVYECYVRGASKYNAYCYFELANIHKTGTERFPRS